MVVVGHLYHHYQHHHLLLLSRLFFPFPTLLLYSPVFFMLFNSPSPFPMCVLIIRIRKKLYNIKRKRLVYFLTILFHLFKSEFCSVPGMSGMVARYLSSLRLNASVFLLWYVKVFQLLEMCRQFIVQPWAYYKETIPL